MTKYLLEENNWLDGKDNSETTAEATLLKEIIIPGLDWLATLLQGAPSEAFLEKMLEELQQTALLNLGSALSVEKEASALNEIFTYFPITTLKEKLSRYYTWLFEGGNPQKTFLLYESAWLAQKLPMETKLEEGAAERETEVTPILALKQYLRNLGYSFENSRNEPLDHLAFELSLLNLALKESNYALSCNLTDRLIAWVTPLHDEIQAVCLESHQKINLDHKVEPEDQTKLNEKDFYPLLFTLLTQLLKKLSLYLSSQDQLHYLSPNREVSYEKI